MRFQTEEDRKVAVSKATANAEARELRLKKRHAQVQADINNLDEDSQKFVRDAQRQVDEEIEKMNSNLFDDYSHEERIRKAGYSPSEAEEIGKISKTKKVGEIFYFGGSELTFEGKIYKTNQKLLVTTPYGSVVPVQTYLNALQESVIATVNQCQKLESEAKVITSGSFVGLITLAFKRLFRRN